MEAHSLDYLSLILYLGGMGLALISGVEARCNTNKKFGNYFLIAYALLAVVLSLQNDNLWLVSLIMLIIPVYLATRSAMVATIFEQNIIFIIMNAIIAFLAWFFRIFTTEVVIALFVLLLLFLLYYNQIIVYQKRKRKT